MRRLVTLFLVVPALAIAQDLPKTQLKVVGSISSLAPYRDFEIPFWTKHLSEKSKGAITAEIKGFNEMGLKGPEVLRLMSSGALEIGATVLDRPGLEKRVCECYEVVKRETDRLFPRGKFLPL